MITVDTALKIARAYIDISNELLAEVRKAQEKFVAPDVRDTFGRQVRGLELGIPNSASSRTMMNVEWRLAEAARAIHHHNQKWWQDPKTGEPIKRNHGELLMLIVSEVAEAMEGDRKNLMDDKLPHRKMLEVELADAVIRIMDMAAGLNLDLAGAIVEKCEFNTTRHDHTHEARLAAGGKAY